MTEQQVRALVRKEIEDALLQEGGICDHAREVAFNCVKDMVEVKFRNLRDHFEQMGVYGTRN